MLALVKNYASGFGFGLWLNLNNNLTMTSVTLDALGIMPGQDCNENQCDRWPGNDVPHRIASSIVYSSYFPCTTVMQITDSL